MYMKKICFIVLLLLIVISNIYANVLSIDEKELQTDQKVAEFSQQKDWINVDSYIDFVGITELKYNEEEITLTQSYFDIFDYIPNTDNTLIATDSLKDIVSIKSESDVNIQVKYNDKYGNEILNGYPKVYFKKQNSADSWSQLNCESIGNNIFNTNFSLDYGSYDYYVVADNANYPDEYISPTKTFVVTERPHSFVNLNPNLQDGRGNSNTILNFSWNASKGVESDVLKYTLSLGSSENSMQEYDLATQNYYTVENLNSRTRYYWKVEVENQYGVKLLNPIIYDFVTLGEIRKVYNAPNPFNPQKGQNTRIFFEMQEDGNVELDIYSEYGDKIYHTSQDNLLKGNNEIVYNGKDDNGNILYNGTYLCVIKKNYSNGGSKTERCRLLIIK